MSEDILEVTSSIKVDESPSEQDDDIPVADGETLFSDLYNLFGMPANLAFKAGMISTPDGLTTIGWAADADGAPIVDLVSNLMALDPVTGIYETVTLNTDPSDDNILIGRTESGNVAFIAVIVPSADGTSSDVYLLDYLPKQHLDDTDPDDTVALEGLFVNVTVEDTIDFSFDGAPSGNNDFMAFGQEGGVAIVVTGRSEGETVNSSQSNNEPTSLAANSNNINAGEGLVVTYVNMMDPDFLVPDLSGPEASNTENIQFESLQSATEGSVTIVKVGPGNTTATVHLTALMTEQEEGTGFIPGIADDAVITITAVYVNDVAVAFTTDASGTVEVTGITNNDVITFETDGEHNRFKVENGGEGNARFNIGGVALTDINTLSDADAITLAFDDDGPTIALTNEGGALQTDDGALAGGNAGGTTTDTEGLGSLFSVAASTGADDANGTDDIVYSLAVGANTATSLVDTATGETVDVSLNGGVIEGRTTATNELVFTVSVDGATGAVTLEQLRAVEHATADTASPYDGDTTGLGVADAIRLVGTISDDESAADSASDFIDISANLSFTDDGPTIALTNEGGALQTDDGALAGGNAGGTTTDTEGLGSLFSVAASTGADDANGTDDIVYSLAVGANTATSLVDTATGETVDVSLNGGVIEGRTTATNELVFTVSVDGATGAVTLEQLRAVEHATADTASPYDGDTTGLGVADAIRLVGTISDDETAADSASDFIDISGNLSFTDDGPTIALTNEGGALQTDDGALAGGNAGGTTTDTEGLGSLFSVTSSTGADDANGTDDIVYSLAVGANTATSLVDTATGETVDVSLNGGVIEGRTTATNELVFTVSVDGATGAVTLEQLRAVEHATADTASPYDGDTTGLGVADAIRLVGTISDDETAADTASDFIDISANLSFTDDGPTIALTNEGGALQTDDGALAGGNAGGTTTDTEGLGSLFSVAASTGADDANGTDDIVYSLAVGANTATSLVDTATGETVDVSLNGGVIEGRTTATNELVFTVSVDGATGAVTLEQLRAVEHATADTASPYDGDTTGLGVADAIRLVGTISDDETAADTASDFIDISGNLSFTDDGPTIALTNEGGALQTDDGALAGGNAGGTTTDTEGLGSLFSVTSSTGADDANGTDDIVYSLAVGANTATSLVDTATGETVDVSLNGGVIEGRTTATNELVFTVSVDGATGAVTLEQLRAVEHATADTASPYDGDTTGLGVADAIRLVGTISDDESAADSASDFIDISANLSFTDDGPTIALTNEGGALQTDDGALAGGNAGGTTTDTEGLGSLFSVAASTGADDANGTDDIVYSLAVGANTATSLVDTATGETVDVSLNGGVIEGRTTATNELVFTVSVDGATGAVTLEQLRAVEHATADTASPYDGDTTGLGVADAIRLVGTISDDETAADTASDFIDISGNLSFTDDGPTIALTNEGGALQTDDGALAGGNAGGTTTDTEGLGSLFSVTSSTGADDANGTDDIVYSLAVGANTATSLVDTATGETVDVSLNGGVIEGRTTATNELVFTVSVDGATGAVTLEQLRAVEHATADTASPYDGDTTGLGVADAIRLVGTISDDESAADTASDFIDISANLSFTDDGPTIELTNEGGALQTDDGALAGGNAGGTTTDTEGLGSLFSVAASTGADDANGTDDIVYSLAVGANTATSLVDTATGETVDVSLNGGVIEGRTTATNELVFTVSVDGATGAVTLEQLRAVEHATADTASPYDGDTTGLGVADAIRLVGTISDDETAADTASDFIDISANLSFTDDGPTIELTNEGGVLQTDDGDLAGGNEGDGTGTDTDTEGLGSLFSVAASTGADDANGTDDIVYSLAVGANTATSLVDTATGETVDVSLNGGVIEGRTTATNELVFTVSVDGATGAVTLEQLRAVEHATADTASPYDGDTTGLGVADAIRLVGTISDDETAADTASDFIDISANLSFTDDGPTIAVGDASGVYSESESDPAKATGTFVDGPGADGFADLAITFDSYEIDDNGLIQTSDPDANVTFMESVTDTTWTGTITDDFNGDGESETVEFTLDVDLESDTYMVTLDTPPGQSVELSTADGSLDAGGPDPVRTLTLVDSSQVVFSAVDPTTDPSDISAFLNKSETEIEAGATYLSDDEMNVSTAGIGNGNNNFDGNADSGIDGNVTNGGKVDESFVIDPTGFNVSSVKVFIDNSVGGYDNPPEELYYRVYYADGTVGAETLVTEGHLSAEAGGQVSFTIGDPEGPNDIDAVQLFMGSGTIKIPVIEFTTSEQFDPDSLELNFTATLEDGDQDTAMDMFSVDFDEGAAMEMNTSSVDSDSLL